MKPLTREDIAGLARRADALEPAQVLALDALTARSLIHGYAALFDAATDDGTWYAEWCEHVRDTCSDPAHDDRWCSTCVNRIDGGEMYAAWLRKRVADLEGR